MRDISSSKTEPGLWLPNLLVIFAGGCLFVGGMTAVRLIYECLFPAALWLGNPAAAVLLAAVAAGVGGLLVFRLFRARAGIVLAPLMLNLVYLFNPATDLTAGWFLFLGSVWLAVLFLVHNEGVLERRGWLSFVFVVSFLLPVYLGTLGQAVGTADSFEFQVVIPKSGIVHPTGYPLYLLLTKLFTFIPFNSIAWRVNLGTAVYGIGAACLLFQFLKSLTGQRLAPILAAILFGLSPTFWSQSIQAEVYSLHALIVAAVLVVMRRIGGWQLVDVNEGPTVEDESAKIWGVSRDGLALAFLLGLGLTNHLTTMILLPAVLIHWVIGLIVKGEWRRPFSLRQVLIILGAFLAPLLLYLYLPLRWQAVNGEPMGAARFVDWVVGGRFQGALQLTGWWADPARMGVVGRLFTAEWGWLHLLIGLIGLILLARRVWRAALFFGLTLGGFTYYALSYYVPDLSVFLIPAHLVIAVFWGVGVAAGVRLLSSREGGRRLAYGLLALVMFFVFQRGIDNWEMVDASVGDGQTRWGRAVLAQDLDPQGAILADSLKFPPLYYLQQAEGVRTEMDIMVLPDEAAYRTELDGRLAAGQTVYLARFLPGLAGVYHLGSVGPLTEVGVEPQETLPETAEVKAADLAFGSIDLIGYRLEEVSPYGPGETAITFYWQATGPVEAVWQVFVRWVGGTYVGPVLSQFPANNSYPTNAWRVDEIVADFHSLPRPVLNEREELTLEVALAPAFTPADELNWQIVTTAVFEPPDELLDKEVRRLQIGQVLIDGVSFPEQIRPGSDLLVQVHGFGPNPDLLSLQLVPAEGYVPALSDLERGEIQRADSFTRVERIIMDVAPGMYLLVGEYGGLPAGGQSAVCSWLARPTTGCVLGEVEVSGAPLPEGAINFEDKIALLAVDVPDMALQPGGQLAVNLTWQALGNMSENYTVFSQVLDEQDRIVGQVDSWPRQGTFPTSQWAVGERIEDPYLIHLPEELPPGQYRLELGWYLLDTLRRLPVLDEFGTAVDDKVVIPLEDRP